MKARDILFRIHLCAGLTIGAVLLIISVTGTMLAFRTQLIAFAEKDIYKSIPAFESQPRLSIKRILDKAQQAYPEGKLTGIVVQNDLHAPVIVNFGPGQMVYVNPYTNAILGYGSGMRHLLEKVEIWHRWLGMEGSLKPIGHTIKSACNVVFLAMIVTGLFLWWPRNWKWKTLQPGLQLNFQLNGKARQWNQHNVIGFWCAPFLLIISLTGIVMSYQWVNHLVYRLAGNVPPASINTDKTGRHSHEAQRDGKVSTINYDMLLEKAKNQAPDWVSINMRLAKPGSSFNCIIEEKSRGPIPQRSQLALNSSGDIMKWEPASHQNKGRQLRTLIRYLHTGEAGGLIGQMTAFLSAAGAVVLIWTGFSMSWQRFMLWRSKI